ncbi:efflux RND transporter periplasmic adaptor subunit [Fontibacillus sp. BL9]|uniref:efflux RND transporter periplasmic adaptor subunit n=1 Tax=Fontibacillus sp. BL9 TaxID=3389971 RepID=UPI00397BB648
MKKKKWIWIGGGAVGIILISLAVLLLILPDKNTEANTPVQRTTKVAKGNILVSVSGSGSVISTDSQNVRTKDEGKVKEVLVKAGDIVKKGQTLLTFEAEDLSDSLETKESSLESQKMDLLDLQAQYKRQVYEGASEEALNEVQKSINKQELNIKSTEKEIASIKEDMVPPDPLVSPMDGTVTTVSITAGEKANSGSELFVINDYQNLSVQIQVDELDIPQVKIGMKATVQLDALPDQSIDGVVSAIANEGSASNGVSLFDVTVKLNQSDGVRVGMSAEASIVLSDKSDILTLPVEAVQKRDDTYFVILPSADTESASAGDRTGGRSPATGDANMPSQPTGDGEMQTPATSEREMPIGPPADSSQDATAGKPNASSQQRTRNTGRANMREVEIGVHNETSIEIVSGLNEGDEVVIPTVISTSSSANQQQEQMMQGSFGGFGGGAAPDGGGFPGGGGGMSGGGGGMPGGDMSTGGSGRGGGGR